LQCVQETRQLFGMVHIIDVLRGSRGKKILAAKHDQINSYGTGTEYSKDQWRQLAGQFVKKGLLQRTQPHGSLVITPEGKTVFDGEVFMGVLPRVGLKTTAPRAAQEYDLALYEQLRTLRLSLAQERNIPSYVVFPDRTLIEMAQYFPLTPETLGQIYGVGARKLEEYAPYFLPIIQTYCQENEIQPIKHPIARQTRGPRRRSAAGIKRTELVWELFQSGKSLDEMVAEVGVKPATILKHFRNAREAGRDFDSPALKKLSSLTTAEEQAVVQAFDEFGPMRLRPIFDALEAKVSYDQLHLWRLIYEIMKNDA